MFKYELKTSINQDKIVFVREKAGIKRNNLYLAIDLKSNKLLKVPFSWIQEHITEISNAAVCGTRLYYRKNKG